MQEEAAKPRVLMTLDDDMASTPMTAVAGVCGWGLVYAHASRIRAVGKLFVVPAGALPVLVSDRL